MAQLLNGSLCLTDIIAKLNDKHSAFSKSAKNGKIYFNFTQWINDEPDQYKNHSSILLNSAEGKQETEGKHYIGHARIAEKKGPEPPKENDTANATDDFNKAAASFSNAIPGTSDIVDDAPF